MSLFLDTNILISLVAHSHKFNYITTRYLNYLKDNKIKTYYADFTLEEFDNKIKKIKRAIVVLDHYPPSKSKLIARKTNEELLFSYYEDGFVTFDYFYSHMINTINHFTDFLNEDSLAKKFNIDKETLNKTQMEIINNISKYLKKSPNIAKHDAYLLALIKILREVHKDWFVDWILTLDKELWINDRRIANYGAPSCMHIESIPLMFYPYTLAESISSNFDYNDSDIYSSLVEISRIASMDANVKSAVNSFNDITDVNDTLVAYLKQICWIEGDSAMEKSL
jgi:hypothetical protein